jgi:zeaxanthin glucosyltransferase
VQTKKILILVWPETSAYNATFRLARVLSRRGYEIVYAVPARWRDHLARQGFQTIGLDISLDVPPASTAWWRHILTGQDEANSQIRNLCESLAWIQSEEFALVLLYATLWHFALVMRHFDIPYILINPCLASVWNLDIPPVFSRLRPIFKHRLLNRMQCALAWFSLRYFGAFSHRYRGILPAHGTDGLAKTRDITMAVRHCFKNVFERFREPVYHQLLRIARQVGIAIRYGDYGHRLVGPEIVLGPQAIDFPRRISPSYRVYAGACVDTERVEDAFDWSRVDEDKPIVYCAVGSHGGYWNQENRLRLINSVIEAFKARPEIQLLLQIADENERKRFEPLPGHILAAPWFPQLQVLSRASLLISHGGFGTVREALFYGVPMIIFPCGVDQPGNGARVQWAQVGLVGDIRTVTPVLIDTMAETIKERRYGDNANRLGKSLQSENTCAEAVALIESALSGM